MRLKPLPLHPLYCHKAFAESVSIHSYMGSAGTAAIQESMEKERRKTTTIREAHLIKSTSASAAGT